MRPNVAKTVSITKRRDVRPDGYMIVYHSIEQHSIRPFVILRILRPRIFESKFRDHCAKKLDGALRKPTSFFKNLFDSNSKIIDSWFENWPCSLLGGDRRMHVEALQWLSCNFKRRLQANCHQLYELGNAQSSF